MERSSVVSGNPISTSFCRLTVGQRAPRFWGVTTLYKSLGIRLPKA